MATVGASVADLSSRRADLRNPQSWNRYAYVVADPVVGDADLAAPTMITSELAGSKASKNVAPVLRIEVSPSVPD
jgi:hypothetical protein